MKKNIKYAGIAAAALLTVAPVASPVVNSISNTNVAQAATTDNATDAQKKAVANFFRLLGDTSVDHGDKIDLTGITEDTYKDGFGYKDFVGLSLINLASNNTQVSDASALENNIVTYKIAGLNGSSVQNYQDFNTKVNSVKKNGGSFTVQIQALDADKTPFETKNLTFTNDNKSDEGVTSLDVNYTNPVVVEPESSVTNVKYTTSVDATIADQNGDDVKVTKVTPSQSIYKTSNAALNQDSKQLFSENTFGEKGSTYYQAVALTVDSDVNVKAIYDNAQNGKDATFMINGTPAILANVDGKAGSNTIRFVREIQVGDKQVTPSEDTWTETEAAGQVRVGNKLANLFDDNNEITSRSIAANTDWATDKYRTNDKTGEVQYRVSTHEWVNASDVTFYAKGDNGNGLGNVTDLGEGHVVTLDGPAGFVYTLFTSDGGNASRGLAGLTAWQTDKSATDAEGNTYYRVSTDEWVRAGSGVNFK